LWPGLVGKWHQLNIKLQATPSGNTTGKPAKNMPMAIFISAPLKLKY